MFIFLFKFINIKSIEKNFVLAMSSFQLHLYLLSQCLHISSECERMMTIKNYRVFKEWACTRCPAAQADLNYDLYKKVRAFLEKKAPHLRLYSSQHYV